MQIYAFFSLTRHKISPPQWEISPIWFENRPNLLNIRMGRLYLLLSYDKTLTMNNQLLNLIIFGVKKCKTGFAIFGKGFFGGIIASFICLAPNGMPYLVKSHNPNPKFIWIACVGLSLLSIISASLWILWTVLSLYLPTIEL